MDDRISDGRIADLHIHSRYSHDSYLSPKAIVQRSRAAGLTCIAVTDHGSIRGGLKAKEFAGDRGPEIIVGTEIRTDCGDIIGLNMSVEIRSVAWKDVIREIRENGGIVVFPHPYRDHSNIGEIAAQADLIECWNGRSTRSQNREASALARQHSRPGIVGSDAHVATEIGSVRAWIGRDSFACHKIIAARYATGLEIKKSRVISCIRQGHWGTLIAGGLSEAGRIIR